jgi:hypothetical protein
VTSRYARAPHPVPISQGHRLTSFTANGINRLYSNPGGNVNANHFCFAIVQINRDVTRSGIFASRKPNAFHSKKIRKSQLGRTAPS